MGGKGWEGGLFSVLRVSVGEGDVVYWIMAAKEEFARRRVGKVIFRNWGFLGFNCIYLFFLVVC